MYEFTEDCKIHIENIDSEHEHLFKLINEAVSAINDSDDVTVLANSIIKNLKDYAATHFAHEEEYMKSINDPELPLQQKQHAAFTAKMNAFSIEGMSNEEAKKTLNELISYLVHWLYKHILSSDMMIGKMCEDTAEDPFAFTDKYKTGVELIDTEHKQLFDIIRDVNDLIHEELLHDKYDEIMRLLAELREYTEFHFGDEEALMKEIHYPAYDAQKRAHTAFIERLVEIDLSELDAMDDNQQEYLTDLIAFHLTWLTNHILGSDKKIGEFIRAQ